MEVLGAVSTVVGLADVIEKRLEEFRARLDRIRQPPDQYATLVATHNRICGKLKTAHAALSETLSEDTVNDIQLFQRHVNAAHFELSTLSEYLDASSIEHASQTSSTSRRRKRVAGALSKFTAKGKAIQRTTRNDEAVALVQSHLDSAWRVLNEIRMVRIEAGVTALATKTGSCIGVIDGNVAGAIGGGGGVGKSCAARALASLQKVRDMFPEGIYEISVGMNAGELALKTELCNCIERSGGVSIAKQMMSGRNMQEVFRKAEGWFAGRKVLFIVDDVWETEEMTRNLSFWLKRAVRWFTGGASSSGGSLYVNTGVILMTHSERLYQESKVTQEKYKQTYDVAGCGALSDVVDTAVQFCKGRHGEQWEQKTGM
ncbi:WD40-repeat containing protein [Gracilaria domingensis]|nr:WD40-repeat containing protein [Gracilaria domingensis]